MVSIFIRPTTRHSQRNQENFDWIDQVAYAIESLFARMILEKEINFRALLNFMLKVKRLRAKMECQNQHPFRK